MGSELQGWKNTALLVIDMQKDFILAGGPLHVKGGESILPNVVAAVGLARARNLPVVWVSYSNPIANRRDFQSLTTYLPTQVVREHDPLGRDVELFRRHLYSPGNPRPTSKGTPGAELADGLSIGEGEYKLVKTRFSAFFNTNLHSFLQGLHIHNLIVTGVQTPNCIRQTVYDAVALDYRKITVISDATAAATPEIHFANLTDMMNIGVESQTLQEWMV
ncbi:hypothetical protein M569_07469 [Genlisea aurea]|uniref:Isochorismatase-like domain-containing protein n=1 Tax=Genlisea aurea TaxID=192259 RepID=S8CQZ2_9LAMI|nr:hypothetical protein M569_07469 [Genlisea aurea]